MEEENLVQDGEFVLDENYDPDDKFPDEEEEFIKIKEILARNDRFGHFSADFGKLLESWQLGHKREQYLVRELRFLRIELRDTMEKLQIATSLIESDQQTMSRLREEMSGALKMVDAAHVREQISQETIDSLRTQVTKLSQELDQNKKLTGEHDQDAGTLVKNKEVLIREKERLMAEVLVAKGKLTKAAKFQKETEDRLDEAESKITALTTEIESLKNNLAKEQRLKGKMESDILAMQTSVSEKDREILSHIFNAQSLNKTMQKMEAISKEQKNQIDKLTKDLQDATSAQKITKADLEQQHANVARITQDLTTKLQDLKLREDECLRLRLEEQKLRKTKENLVKKLALFDGQRTQSETDKSKLLTSIDLMTKEMNELKKQLISSRKIIDTLNREKELIEKSAKKFTAVIEEQQATMSLLQVEKKRSDEEVNSLTSEVTKLQQELKTLQGEKEVVVTEIVQTKKRVENTEEDCKLKKGEINDLNKKLSEAEAKMRLHVQLFEQVRAERNKVSKSLVEAEDEIKELTHKLKVKSYEVEQLKDDICAKESMLVKGEFLMQKINKEKESIKIEKQQLLTQLRETKERVQMFVQEEKELQKVVETTDADRVRLTKDINQLTMERDTMASLLQRRNEEVGLLYEKVTILEDIMRRSEAQYQQRTDDIRLLKIEVKRLRQEKALLTRNINNSADLRREMFHLERDFTKERLKSRALEEELSNPLNVHRWRKLEGSDPPTFQLVHKLRLLQKRLIASSEEAIKREEQLAETQKLYSELQDMVAKMPSSDVNIKLYNLQTTLREKTQRIKTLTAEMSMYEEQVSEYKLDVQHKTKELDEMKRKYYALKRREQKVREREGDLDRERSSFLPLLEPMPSLNKFVGGGFNLNSAPLKTSSSFS